MDEDLEEDVDLDAIVGSAFDDEDDDDEEDDEDDDLLDRARAVPEPPKLPTKAKQHRPDPIEGDLLNLPDSLSLLFFIVTSKSIFALHCHRDYLPRVRGAL